MKYEPNPKHKEPWQPGRKGSLCPALPPGRAQELLERSTLDGATRFATDGERAYAAHEHGADAWHGHPVGFVEVPEKIRRSWLGEQLVSRAAIRARWTLDD